MFEKEIIEVLEVGDPMLDYGVNNWALNQAQANKAIDKLEKMMIPILGGDVYVFINGKYKSTNDHWALDQIPGESRHEYVSRTVSNAKYCVELYTKNHGHSVRFVLVTE